MNEDECIHHLHPSTLLLSWKVTVGLLKIFQVGLTVFLLSEMSIYFTFSTTSLVLLQYIWNQTNCNPKKAFSNGAIRIIEVIVISSLSLDFFKKKYNETSNKKLIWIISLKQSTWLSSLKTLQMCFPKIMCQI